MPSRLGNGCSLAWSPCDRQAAVPTAMAEAAPQVTMAAGASSNVAIRAPTFFSSSGNGMKKRDASCMALMTSGGMIEPPSTVTTPTPLMTGLIPRLAYRDDGDAAVTVVLVAATAAAGDSAAVCSRRRRVVMTVHYRTPLGRQRRYRALIAIIWRVG